MGQLFERVSVQLASDADVSRWTNVGQFEETIGVGLAARLAIDEDLRVGQRRGLVLDGEECEGLQRITSKERTALADLTTRPWKEMVPVSKGVCRTKSLCVIVTAF